jgi:hypothetical protein
MRLPLIPLMLLASLAFSQNPPVAPVPTSPYELVTGPVKLLDETDQRASVLGLIERARQNSDLHAPGGHPYLLKVSFEASGNVPYTGSGQLEELWYAPGQWRWTTNLGSYVQSRIYVKGRIFDAITAPMPLRVQMVRENIFWPVIMRPGAALRISAGTWKGTPVLCVLGSRSFGDDASNPGRRWEETEFCMDTKSGLLQTYSVAPGIYAVYDYQDALHFHASILPRTISIYEDKNAVLQIRLDSITDAGPLDPKLFTPSPQMSQGNGPMIAGTIRIPMAGGVSPVPAKVIQPVIVHAGVNAEGKVQEVESLQTSDLALSAAAVALVKNATYRFPRFGPGSQQEIFVNVRFTPPPTVHPGE